MIFIETVYCCKNRFAVAMWVPHPRQAGEGSRRKCRGRGSGRPTCAAGGARRKRRPVAGPGVGQTRVLGKQKGHSGEKSVRVLRVDGAGALGDRRCGGLGPPECGEVYARHGGLRRGATRSNSRLAVPVSAPSENTALKTEAQETTFYSKTKHRESLKGKKIIKIMHEAESSRTLY